MLRSPWTRTLIFLVCLAPLARLGWQAWHENITANPIEYITHLTGDWTIRFLVLTLAVTPLRRWLRLPDLIRFRRMLGLYAFFYGTLHFLTWLWLDKAFDWREIAQDVTKRRFITVGFLSLLLMLPLAITSTRRWIQHLGAKRWQLLHRLVYVTAVAGVVHYYWLVKSDIRLPALYGAIVVILLAARRFGSPASPSKNTIALRLAGIQRQTGDTVTLQFALSGNKPLNAKPGQFLTFDWVVDGRKQPRSYSISSSPLRSDYVEVTVKQQGTVSSFLNHGAREGLLVKAHGPFGQFYFDKARHRSIVLFAGGSGITPIMSMLRYIGEAAADTGVTLLYAVRTEADMIFREELDELAKRLPRFRHTVVLSSPGGDWRGPRGRVNRSLIEEQLGEIGQQTFFLCGPAGFMANVRETLMSLGARAEQIRQERFTIGAPDAHRAAVATYPVEFAVSGGKYEYSPADSLLLFAESHGIDIPGSCRAGQCGTCATRVLDGEVEMETEEGLEPSLRAQGYRLMCVGRAHGPVRLEA